MNPKLKKYQLAMRRAPDGKLLGVFKGIAEGLGWSVKGTRILGVIILLSVAGAFGVEGTSSSILAVGFFYLLLAMLMRPPLASISEYPAGEYRDRPEPPRADAYPPRRDLGRSVAAVPRYPSTGRRVNLAELDRQIDGLNRRIQRMETIVTDRQYDWDRRMNS